MFRNLINSWPMNTTSWHQITSGSVAHRCRPRARRSGPFRPLVIHDYGAPIGLRIASRRPERITALITQSGNAYLEGFTPFWDVLFAHAKDRAANEEEVREKFTETTTRWQYTHGVPVDRLDRIAPDAWELDQLGLDRKDPTTPSSCNCSGTTSSTSTGIRRSRRYFRTHQPPLLVTWGKNDEIFGAPERRGVPPRFSQQGVPPARRRALRAGNARRGDQRIHPRLPWPRDRRRPNNRDGDVRAAVL